MHVSTVYILKCLMFKSNDETESRLSCGQVETEDVIIKLIACFLMGRSKTVGKKISLLTVPHSEI